MMKPEQLDNWFRYHAPTPETAPKYKAIRDACETTLMELRKAVDELAPPAGYQVINDACKAYAIVIDQNAPDSADKTAAIRCVRLARNAANEALSTDGMFRDWTVIHDEILKARWQASAAVACGGV